MLRIRYWLMVCALIGVVWMFHSRVETVRAIDPNALQPHRLVLAAADLRGGTTARAQVGADGVQADADGAIYTTPPQQVKLFSDILLTWQADVPLSATLDLELRTSTDGLTWTDWAAVADNDDLLDERDTPDQHWGTPLFAGKARWWQARAHFGAAPNGDLPTLHLLQADTVDVGTLPDPGTPPAPQVAVGVGKPGVISRTGWGNPDGQGSRARPAYYPVTHLVVHHTVDPNGLTDQEGWWGDRVRAIWVFHTYTRGWGDIGYNYLVAPDGQIFEGRAGGDNAVGFHDTGNYGSMGVALIGTYASVPPTQSAQASLVELLAWKADQRGIDPLGTAYYYGCDISRFCGNRGARTPNIAGHRQVANNPPGYTSCPGNGVYDLLPTIRARVSSRLSSVPDNGDMTIDELESSFTRSPSSWYEAACGDGGHIFYTYATDNVAESSNWGRWRKEGLEAGNYRIYAHVPQNCGALDATHSARYSIWQNGVKIGEQTVDQDTSNEWIEITAGPLALADLPVEVHLKDLTAEPLSANRKVLFDTVRWVRDVPQASIDLENVEYDRSTLTGGQLLKVTFTVRNTGNVTIQTQGPNPGNPDDGFSGYTYDEGECFIGDVGGLYPAYPKESGRFRVILGSNDGGYDCAGDSGGYPWRWGLGDDLAPGERRTIVGYVRFRNLDPNARQVTLRAGLINEYVNYVAQDQALQTLTVLPEADAPHSTAYDSNWLPLAYVSELGTIPDDFLARTANPLSIPEGVTLGSFGWDGSRIDWGEGGPFNRADLFVVRQTRTFNVPAAGVYRFRVTSDDGAWLWVDGTLMVENYGLHTERDGEGERWLTPGEHTLSFKYFERTANAVMSYEWSTPDSTEWQPIPVIVGGGVARRGAIFGPQATITVGADDQGGSGVDHIRWSFDGVEWFDEAGDWLTLQPGGGVYNLRYQAVDRLGNTEDVRELYWSIDAAPPNSTISQASVLPSGIIQLELAGTDDLSGLERYETSLRDMTDGEWHVWQTTSEPVLLFIGLPGHSYEFRVRAVDQLGNWEPEHQQADASATTPDWATFYHTMLPVVLNGPTPGTPCCQ